LIHIKSIKRRNGSVDLLPLLPWNSIIEQAESEVYADTSPDNRYPSPAHTSPSLQINHLQIREYNDIAKRTTIIDIHGFPKFGA
jgi:hypothetical protein